MFIVFSFKLKNARLSELSDSYFHYLLNFVLPLSVLSYFYSFQDVMQLYLPLLQPSKLFKFTSLSFLHL